jgi:hypothetical protein
MVRACGANLTFEPPFAACFRSNAKFKNSMKFMRLRVVLLSPALSMGALSRGECHNRTAAIFWMSPFFHSARVRPHV